MEKIKRIPRLKFSEALQVGLENIKDFDGRARRSEFWWFMLSGIIAITVEFALLGIVMEMAALGCIVAELIMLGCLSVTVRRLHDTGKNGIWAFLSFTLQIIALIIMLFKTNGGSISNTDTINELMASNFFIGVCGLNLIIDIVIMIFCLIDSKKEENDYGESNKYLKEN